MRLGMVINLAKCVGCYSCVISCKQEYCLPPGMMWGRLLISETGVYPKVTKHMYPVLCNHCKKPLCVDVCPADATQQREDGIVWVEQDKCVGCRYCLIVCPYQVRSYYSKEGEYFVGQGLTEFEKLGRKLHPLQTGVVYKCDFCRERIDEGIKHGMTPGVDPQATPVCVINCPAKARYFGDLDDPYSEISSLISERRAVQFHPEFNTDPSVYYVIG